MSVDRLLLLTAWPSASARAHLGGRVLLTPNDRAAGALRGAAAEGKGLTDLAEELLAAAGWQPASEVSQLTALRRAVRDRGELGEGAAAATSLAAAVRELLRSGLGSQETVGELLASDDLAERTKALVRVALLYREVLAEGRAVDPAEVLWRAAELEPKRQSVLVAGYPRVGLAELVFLDALAAPGSVMVLPAGFAASAYTASVLGERGWSVEHASETFGVTAAAHPAPAAAPRADADGAEPPASSHLGVELARRFTAAFGSAPSSTTASVPASTPAPAPASTPSRTPAPDPRLRALRLPTQEEEVRHALAEVKRLLRSGVDPGVITLVARDEQLYGPLVEAVAWEFGVPVKLSYGVPLRSTRLGELVAGVGAALSESLPFEATARLLAHPLLRALDAEAWGEARRTHPAGAAAWSRIAPAAALLAWPERASLDEYRSMLQRLLEETGAVTRLSEREERARESLERALSQLDQRAGLPQPAFLALLDELLTVLSISVDPPDRRGVEFHTPLAVFGADYQHVFILGAAEGVLPAALGDDPLLDFFERERIRAHGLPLEDAMEASERESLSFLAAVLTAGTSLTLSYPELLADREQLASPFFAALGVAKPAVPPARPAASEPERLTLGLRELDCPARRAWEVEARRESDAEPDLFDGMIGVPVDIDARSFSASQLATLGQCAFRWFAQRLLGLAEPEEAEEDVSAMLLGSIYHKTLELATARAWDDVGRDPSRPRPGQTRPGWDEGTATAFRDAAVAHLDAAFTEAQVKVGTPAAASWPLQRREHLEKLARVVRAPDFLLPETEVVALERRFTGAWRGFPVVGFVDRVDDGPGGLVLTDYKTGKSTPLGAKNSRGEPKLDLQLPLYRETAAPLWFGEDHPVAKARYYSLNGAATILESKGDEFELEHFVARARALLEAGDFPVDPDEDQKVCAYCEFDALCRRGPRLGRKRQRAEREAAPGGPNGPRAADADDALVAAGEAS